MSFTTRKLVDICSMRTGKLNSNAAVPNGVFPFLRVPKKLTASTRLHSILKPSYLAGITQMESFR